MENEQEINQRKIEHIRILQENSEIDRQKSYFDHVHLKHRALPELDFNQVDPSCEFMGKTLSFPLLISSMTGGDHELTKKINQNLAKAAQATDVAMAVGSQRVMFSNESAKASFSIREYAPDCLLFANLGGVQLNYGFDLGHCQQAIEHFNADALYLHLNPLQEVIQPEGDVNFAGLSQKIMDLAEKLDKPIILKEVGAGISVEDYLLLQGSKIQYIDVAGSGGTSWSRVESERYPRGREIGLNFADWGIPTPLALQNFSPWRGQISLIASGGIRNGLDMAKAVILGASLCGMALPLLEPAIESTEAVIQKIEELKREFKTCMFLLGIPKIQQILGNASLILRMTL